MTMSLRATKGQNNLGGTGTIMGSDYVPLLHVGTFQATKDAPLLDASNGNVWPNNGVGRWLEAISDRLVMPFHFKWLSGLPLYGDGSASTPPTTVVYDSGAVSLSTYSGVSTSEGANNIINEALTYGENYSGGRKGFVMLRLFDVSTASGAGAYTYAEEIAAATNCINKVIARGWIPIVLTPVANLSTTATTQSAGQQRYRQLFDWVMQLGDKFPGVVPVDVSTQLHTQTPPWSYFYGTSATIVSGSDQITNTNATQALQNPQLFAGSANTFLYQESLDTLTAAGAIMQAKAIWDKLVSMGYFDQTPRRPMPWVQDRSVWGPSQLGYGNPLMFGSSAFAANGGALAGQVATGYGVIVPTFTNPVISPSGVTPSVGRDWFGRNYMRADININWQTSPNGSTSSLGPLGFAYPSPGLLTPDSPSQGVWFQGRARIRIGDQMNNLSGIRFNVDCFGAQRPTASFFQKTTTDTTYLALLKGQELVLRTTPYRWGSSTTAIANAMNRFVPSIGLMAPAGAMSVSGQMDLYELSVNYLDDFTEASYY
jgi:hypothetical protein